MIRLHLGDTLLCNYLGDLNIVYDNITLNKTALI